MIDILWKEMITIDINKKVVLVTGASSGIGSAVANMYMKKGYLVCGLDINPISSSDEVDEYICDVSSEEDVKRALNEIGSKYRSVNYVINCAGIFFDKERSLIEDMSIPEWKNVCTNNLTSNFIVTKNVIPFLRRAEGDKAIVNISSDQALFPRKKNSAYAVSKAGIDNFTRSCAVELIEHRIRVNCILPASVRSDFIRKLVDNEEEMEKIYEKENEKMPLGVIEPWEVAELICFLGSEKAAKITGQSILINSGLYI